MVQPNFKSPRGSSSQGFSRPNAPHCTSSIVPFQRPLLALSPSGQMLTFLLFLPQPLPLHQLFVHLAVQLPLWCSYSLTACGLTITAPSSSFLSPTILLSRQNTHTALLSPFIFPYKSASSGYTERKLVWASGFNSWLLKDLTRTWFHILAWLHWFPICSPRILAAQPHGLVQSALKTQKCTMVN